MRRRVVLPAGGLIEGRLSLPPAVAHHLRVLRLGPGAELELTDGEGREAQATLLSLDKRSAQVAVSSVCFQAAEEPEIFLLQGVGKGEKLDRVVRPVAELGAAAVVPVWSARAVARQENRVDRLRDIAEDALRISRRVHRTRIEAPVDLEAALGIDADLKLALVVGAEASLRQVLEGQKPRRVAVLVGPEGGFSEAEVRRAKAAGFRPVHLGRSVLRTETAGPAVVAMLRYALGEDG